MFDKIKQAWKSKTIRFGVLVAVLGYLESARGDIDALIAVLHLDALRPFIWPAVGVSVIVLRYLTTQPVNDK